MPQLPAFDCAGVTCELSGAHVPQGQHRRRDASAAAARVFILLLRGWYSDIMLMNRSVSGPEIREAVDGFLRLFLAGRASW